MFAISWNLTRRCNQHCAHCYMSAFPRADLSGELTTIKCLRVIDEIAEVNPHVFLILTGGEPLLRKDLFDIAGRASGKGFTVVLGSNGTLLNRRTADRMKESGIMGASISLDSVDRRKHDAFRALPGSWDRAIRATRVLKEAGLDFSLHFSVMPWNTGEIPAVVDLARDLGARVLNVFFVVRTGRGLGVPDIDARECERVLRFLARLNHDAEPGRADPLGEGDPWSLSAGKVNDPLVRVRCAPHFRRVIYEIDPCSPNLMNYAHGGCPAGRHYCRIGPAGDVTPCPYIPLSAGRLRERSFGEIWREAALFQDFRSAALGGRCGTCEFREICGGCRCRAYAATGDYLAEDLACSYQPGRYGGCLITLPEEQTFGLEVAFELSWEGASKARLMKVPSFARGMVVKAVEAFARAKGSNQVTPELLQEAHASFLKKGGIPPFVTS
ncbi:MAG: radical SAM protein [Nitrospinota bacterium]